MDPSESSASDDLVADAEMKAGRPTPSRGIAPAV